MKHTVSFMLETGRQTACQINKYCMKIIPLFEDYTEDKFFNPLKDKVKSKLLAAETPEQIEKAIADNEKAIADTYDKNLEGYLDCDMAADLMHYLLKKRNIDHQLIIGKSDEGSSHAYVKIGNKRYDPTKQGFGNMKDEHVVKT